MLNSTVGILGFFNPAEKIGLKPHKEDVGQTLGSYGDWTWLLFCPPNFRTNNCDKGLFGMIADTFMNPLLILQSEKMKF